MKNLIIFLVIVLAALQVKAQEYKYVSFPDSNAVWSEVYWKPIFQPDPRWVYNQYALFNEDTVINEITYHKLFHSNSSAKITQNSSICIGGIREDSLKRVFVNSSVFQVVPEIKEVLIYDFSLNEGDTLYNDYAAEICTNCFRIYEVVSNIDTIKTNNEFRKVYIFDNQNKVTWIEGTGSLQGLLECWPAWPTNGIFKELICMHQNDTLMYYNKAYDSCVPQFVIDDVVLLPNTDIKVYPNPTTKGVIYFENLDFETLELFDSNGNLIRMENTKGLSCYELDVLNITPGIYYYRLKTKGLAPTKGKLIVQ